MDKEELTDRIHHVSVVISLLYEAPNIGETAVLILVEVLDRKVNELKSFLKILP